MELLLLLLIFAAHHLELSASQQKCPNTSNKLVQGRAFPGFGFNVTETAVNTTVPHVYGCRHLCQYDPGCVALSFVERQDAKPNCFLANWNLGPQALSKHTTSLVILFTQKHCAKGFDANGGWSEWFDDTPCPDACYKLNVTQRRTCLKPYEECEEGFCTGNDYERQRPCYVEEIESYHNATTEEEICFGAKDETFGSFMFYPCTGLYRMKLVHLSGGVSCVGNYDMSPFGCVHNDDVALVSITTSERDDVVLEYGALSLTDGDASNATYVTTQECFLFTKGQTYKLWYQQDLNNNTEDNNYGTSCVWVLITTDGC